MKIRDIFEGKTSAIDAIAMDTAKNIRTRSHQIEDALKQRSGINFTAERAQVLILQQVMHQLGIRLQDLAQDKETLKPTTIDVRA